MGLRVVAPRKPVVERCKEIHIKLGYVTDLLRSRMLSWPLYVKHDGEGNLRKKHKFDLNFLN